MKKVLVLALLVLAIAVPAGAAYQFNWSSGFEPLAYCPGALTGQGGWFLPDNPSYTTDQTMDIVAGAGRNGTQGIVERNGVSMNAKSFVGNYPQYIYKQGFAKFWVYDPGYNTALGRVDARVGVYSDKGTANSAYMATAQIQDATSRDQNYWYAQWASSVAKLDGTTTPGGAAGYSFTIGPAAPRVYQAWSYVMINWTFTYNTTGTSTGVVQWRVNTTGVTPNLTLNLDSTSTRWANFHNIAGIYVGDGMTTSPNGRQAAFDDIEFHGNTVPEPSSLLALGTGALGLLGLIRRRK